MKLPLLITLSALLITACNPRPKRVGWKQQSLESETKPGTSGDGEEGSGLDQPNSPAPGEEGDLAPPVPGLDLVWKRYRAFEHGLVEGLGLKKNDFCMEIGKQTCIDQTHLTVLGGNEPYKAGQFDRSQAPSVLTAIAVDRVVLAACSQRLEMDRKAGASAIVFKHFPLAGAAPSSAQVSLLTKELYQRILARNPEEAEIKAVTTLGGQGLSNDRLALMLCFAIASSSENILL